MNRIYSPSPTVRSSRVPLYLQGLAQDGFDFPDFSAAPEIFSASGGDEGGDGGLDAGQPPDIVGLPADVPMDESFTPIDVPDLSLQPLMAEGFTAEEADQINQALASGNVSEEDFQSLQSGALSPDEFAQIAFGESVGQVEPPAAGRGTLPTGGGPGGSVPLTPPPLKVAPPKSPVKPNLPPGPSPRTTVPSPAAKESFWTRSTIFKSVPDVAVYGLGIAAVLAIRAGAK